MNTKHADILAQLNIVKRKRGRPRKYLVDPPDSFENIKFENYFNEEKRKPEVNEEGKPKEINKEEIAKKVFDDLAVRYANRNGGYTRILKLDERRGDDALKVVLELVEKDA